jgi:hypothetical protein
MDGPSAKPERSEARREQAAWGGLSFVSFFGRAKKETRRAGTKPRI